MKTLIIISLIISIFLCSSVSISVDEFKIKDLDSLKQIIKCLINKNIKECVDYFNIIAYIKIYILKIIPIKILKIDNKFIKKKLNKIIKNRNLKMNKKSKFKIKSNIRLRDIIFKELAINMNIDMKNSYYVAMLTSVGNILLSYLYTFLLDKSNVSNTKKCKYKIGSKFKNKNDFYLNTKFEITINIFTILSKVEMYKSKYNVNNTNKFKAKEII